MDWRGDQPAERPVLVGVGAAEAGAGMAGIELLAEAPAALDVDPVETGVVRPVDMRLPTVPDLSRPVRMLTDQDQPLTITHTGDPGRGRQAALIVTITVVVVLALASVLAVVATKKPNAAAKPTTTATSGTAGPTTAPSGPAATLRALPAAGKPGDVMRAVAIAPNGMLVAVGESTTDRVPRAWRFTKGSWVAIPGPGAGTSQEGAMTGLAAGPSGFVAVGWFAPRSGAAPTKGDRHAAIWTSNDGANWTLQATPKLGELTDVAARPGGFVAAGTDWVTDPDSGDGALLTSPDGRRWTRLRTTGLDGPGPTALRRLLPSAGGAVAIGARLDGTVTRTGLWSSPDLTSWTETATLPGPGAATAGGTALARLGNGTLVVVGGSNALDGAPTPLLWTGSPGAVKLRTLRAPAGTVTALISANGRLIAIGSHRTPTGDLPSGWTLTVP
ncbi:MAG TPA: hypothetical protein VMU51_38500 [Mycobacteriales bacterium]|nr:hypothetical protein [Mycobacteriales bacterium]